VLTDYRLFATLSAGKIDFLTTCECRRLTRLGLRVMSARWSLSGEKRTYPDIARGPRLYELYYGPAVLQARCE
jgi:hypothetical protein